MRIGVDATCWHNLRGYGRHARNLLAALADEDRDNQYTLVSDAPFEPPRGMALRVVESSRLAAEAASSEGRRSLSDMWKMSRALSDPAFDVVLFPSVYSYVPVSTRARKAVFLHDVIAETFPHLTHPQLAGRMFWRAKVALALRQADLILTVSEYSRRGIAAHFGLPEASIAVAGEAPDPIFRRLDTAPETPDRTIVYAGGFGPHKNVAMLVDVFLEIAAEPEFAEWRLILVGERRAEVFHSEAGGIERRTSGDDRVSWTGFLPDEELVALLNRAYVTVLPSLMEGFGLPAVEAAACGCPSIVTTESPLPELLGTGCLAVDPRRPQDMEEALRSVLRSGFLRSQMAAAVQAAAMGLSWRAAARQTRKALQSLASR